MGGGRRHRRAGEPADLRARRAADVAAVHGEVGRRPADRGGVPARELADHLRRPGARAAARPAGRRTTRASSSPSRTRWWSGCGSSVARWSTSSSRTRVTASRATRTRCGRTGSRASGSSAISCRLKLTSLHGVATRPCGPPGPPAASRPSTPSRVALLQVASCSPASSPRSAGRCAARCTPPPTTCATPPWLLPARVRRARRLLPRVRARLDADPRRLGHRDLLPRGAPCRDGLDAREVRPGWGLDAGGARRRGEARGNHGRGAWSPPRCCSRRGSRPSPA